MAVEYGRRGESVEVNSALAVKLDEASARAIQNWAERITALAYLKLGYEVYHQIPVGYSRIDFLMKDQNENLFLVEVTGQSERQMRRDERKKRQIKSMEGSGLPFYVFHNGNIKDLQRRHGLA